jgi:tetratricopeptide (TPR) repeat protein
MKTLMSMNRSASIHLALALALLSPLSWCGCSKQGQKAKHMARAETYFAAAEYEKAAIEYRNVLGYERTNTVALTRLARIFCEQGLPIRAMQLVAEARLKPDDPVLRRIMAELILAQGDRTKARSEFQALLAANPTDIDTLLLYVGSAAGAQEVGETEARLRDLAQATSNAPPVQFAQAMLLYRQGQLQQAEERIQRLLQTSPLAQAHAQMVQFHLMHTNPAAAVQSLAEAARLAPVRSPIRIAHATSRATAGHLEEARSLLTDLLKKAPDYAPAIVLLARVELQDKSQGRSQDRSQDKHLAAALALTGRALRLDPLNIEVRQLRSQIYVAQDKATTSVKEWEQFEGQTRPNGVIKLEVAKACAQAGDTSKAAAYVEQAIRLSSNRLDATAIEAQLMKARLALSGPSPAEAVPTLQSLLQRTNVLDARLLLVEAWRKSDHLKEAVTLCRDLGREHPGKPDFTFMLGVLLYQQGNLNEARTAFRRTLEQAPGNLLAIYQLVDVELAAADKDAALRLVQTELARQTNSPPLHYLEGRVFAARRQWPQAETSLRRCLELDPSFSGAYQMLGSVYMATTNLAGAAKELEQVVARQSENVQARMMLASIYEGLGDPARAREAYEKALAVRSDFVPALNNLAYLQAVSFKQLDTAQALAQKANRLAPEDGAVADTLGWIHYLRGEHQKAQAFLVEAAGKSPGNPVIQFHLGMNSYMIAQTDTARKALERAVASTEPFKEREEAKRRLSLLGEGSASVPQDLAELENRVKSQPKDLMARSLLAQRYERENQPQKAAVEYEEILR